MATTKPVRIKSISEYHRILGLPKPQHPLISIINFDKLEHNPVSSPVNVYFDFYSITLKRMKGIKYKYGQVHYDFEDDGILFFMAPRQILKLEIVDQAKIVKRTGWMLLIHPDFIWDTPLAKGIKKYEFFDYSVNEALFLSEKEEKTLNGIVKNIEQEYQANMDNYSQSIIVSHIDTLLTYSDRFYHRQFLTRKKTNHQVLDSLEKLLTDYFNNDDQLAKGLPSVHYLSDNLNISASYLSRLLKVLTGQTTQQHIHNKLIEKAKEKLSTTELTISEIAYGLGFEHSQAFSRLFKSKTSQSPLAFRQSFN
jgi:AraC-like DNA-binding protein